MTPEMIATLCRLAEQFQDTGEPIHALLARSGYTLGDAISDQDLEDYLKQHPELINSWLIESKNTTENPAWYLLPPKDGSEWTVTQYPQNSRNTFPDKFKACAFYIRVYVMQLASRQTATFYGRVPKWRP